VIASPITEAQVNMEAKVFQNLSNQPRDFENFRGGSVSCLKNHWGQSRKREPQANTRVAFQP